MPPTLSDSALAGVGLEVTPVRQCCGWMTPGGKAALLHDRQWHIFWEDRKLVVLKRLSGGQVIAQCNLMVGPDAGTGRHQDLSQFRDDIRRGLKSRFVQFLGAGEIDGHPAGGFRYKVGVQGAKASSGSSGTTISSPARAASSTWRRLRWPKTTSRCSVTRTWR